MFKINFTITCLIVLLFVSALDALTLTEPQSRAVYQRNWQNRANVPVAGTVLAGLVVEARYSLQSTWQPLNVTGTSFNDFLKVPAGGWYTIEVRARQGPNTVAAASIEKIGAGEVFITAGQSNSANYGSPVATPGSDLVSAWAGTRWQLLLIHNREQPAVVVRSGRA